jgi:hypothetical protein
MLMAAGWLLSHFISRAPQPHRSDGPSTRSDAREPTRAPLRCLHARRGEARKRGGMLGTRHLPDIPSLGLHAHIAVTPILSMHVLAPTTVVLPVTLMSTLALGNVVMMEGERVSGTGCPRERVKSA